MPKRIVCCTDGTWDNSDSKTNVYRMYKAVNQTADQIAFYDDGVGANGTPVQRLLGGAFGSGLFERIKHAYTKIAHVYEAGDEIFLFGFSRGAYTARSLAGMIGICGLPTGKFDDQLVDVAFNAYRHKEQRSALLDSVRNCNLYDAKVTMIGVWDTVGSLGIPALFGGVSSLLYGFLDTSLNPDVLNAFHALAIDERRIEFPPTLWSSTPAVGQTLEQVWFCGTHSDVGGGYSADVSSGTALSDITLAWMMDKACALGLQTDTAVQAQYTLLLDPKYALDEAHDSWTPVWGFPKSRTIDAKATLADSVVIRCQHHSWRPANLKLINGVPASDYLITPVVGQPLQTAASALKLVTQAAAS